MSIESVGGVVSLIVLAGLVVYSIVLLCIFYGYKTRRLPGEMGLVHVIIPCKGSDKSFIRFLHSLNKQSYRNIKLLFCTASAHDACIASIKRHVTLPYEIVISSPMTGCSQMNQNQIAGVEHITRSDCIAIVDADGDLPERYFEYLIGPLRNPDIFCSSTYRTHQAFSWGGIVIKYWNLIGLRFKQLPVSSFCWGGGMAFRYADFVFHGLVDLWRTGLSDDMPINRYAHAKGLRIHPVDVYVRSTANESYWDAMCWIIRQSVMVYYYHPFIFVVYIVCLIPFGMSIAFFLLSGQWMFLVPFVSALIGVVLLTMRFGTVHEMLLSPFISVASFMSILILLCVTPFVRTVYWGGIRYDLDGHGRIIHARPIR